MPVDVYRFQRRNGGTAICQRRLARPRFSPTHVFSYETGITPPAGSIGDDTGCAFPFFFDVSRRKIRSSSAKSRA